MTQQITLLQFIQEKRGNAAQLAKAIGAHPPDVSKWAHGDRPIPVHFGAPIEKETGNRVSRKTMFPDSWRTIWPELAEKEDQETQQPDAEPAH